MTDEATPSPVPDDAPHPELALVENPEGTKWRGAADLVPLLRAISALVPDQANARRHPARNLADIRTSLTAHGQLKNVVVNQSGKIAAGNGTIRVALEMGWTHVAVVRQELTPREFMEYALRDNASALSAEWDDQMLGRQLMDLGKDGVKPTSLGFDDDLAAKLISKLKDEETKVADPEPEQPPEVPWTQLGDLIEIGPHRLYCGDSTLADCVAMVMQGELADLVFTDPPYGVAYESKSTTIDDEKRTIANDDLGLDGTRDFAKRIALAWPLRAGGAWYVCSASGDMETAFRFGLVDAGERLRSSIVWVKNSFVLGHQDYHYQHETILYGWKLGAGHFWCGSRSETSVWNIPKPARSPDHPTMKPIEVPARGIRNSSLRDQIVFDGFGGSGTTLIAAHQLGRRARLIEISPGFCDVIVKRAQALGLTATVTRPGVEGPIAWGSPLAA